MNDQQSRKMFSERGGGRGRGEGGGASYEIGRLLFMGVQTSYFRVVGDATLTSLVLTPIRY